MPGGRGRLLLDGFLGIGTGLALLFPLIMLGAHSLRLSGMGEESVGYRYFYSLRILNSENERPWLPQGQLMGVVHEAIQRILTWTGHPASEVYPRIELFSYLAAALPFVIAIPIFIWAVRPLDVFIGKVLLALAAIAVSYEPRAGGGYHLAIPDYYTWVIPLALIALGWVFRVLRQEPKGGLKRAILLGIFAGCCLAVKPTYCVLALIVALVLCVRSATVRDAFTLCFASSFIAVQVSYLITLLYYRGDNIVALRHFEPAAFEGLSRDAAGNVWQWLEVAVLGNSFDATKIVLVWPCFLILALIYLPRRLVTFSLLPSAVLTVVLAYQRFYPPTLIELNMFGLTGMAIWIREGGPALRKNVSEWARHQRIRVGISPFWLGSGFALALGLLSARGMWTFVRLFEPCYVASAQANLRLDSFLAAHPGRTLFVVPDNNFRPTTVDSAIYKGGTNLYEDVWEKAAFVPSLFPNRDYIIHAGNLAIHPDRYDTLVYVALKGQEKKALEENSALYDIHQDLFSCPFEANLSLGPTNFFLPAIANSITFRSMYSPIASHTDRVLIGCVRKPVIGERPAEASENAIYSEGQLLMVEDQRVTRLTGVEGQVTQVLTLGAWDEERRTLAGLPAVRRSERWVVDTSSMQPAATRRNFETLASSHPSSDFWLGQALSVTRMSDEVGTFLRVRARKPLLYAGVYSAKPINSLDGAPMTVRAQVRTYAGQVASLLADDVTQPSGQPRRYEQKSKQAEQWAELTLHIPKIQFAESSDHIGLEIDRLRGGDYFDIRFLEGYIGVRP